jgi:hypothetical protein
MKLTYRRTFENYKAANQLHIRLAKSRRVKDLIFFLGIPILAAGLFMAIVVAAVAGSHGAVEFLVPLEAGSLWFAISLPLLRAANLRKCFKRSHSPNRTDPNSYLEITEEGIFCSVPGVCEGRIFWPGVFAFAQDDSVTLIYTAPKRFLFFPTSVLAPEQRDELDRLIDRHRVNRNP